MIMVLIGPSGAGKTTFAKNHIKNNPGWVRVSRDDIRSSMTGNFEFGSYFQQNNYELEKHVTQLQMDQIRYWVSKGVNVIVDNPHLKTHYLHVYKDHFGYLTDIMFVPIRNADPETCKKRIIEREGDVNVDYIDRHFVSFRQVLQEAAPLLDRTIAQKNHQKDLLYALNHETDQQCVIVDLDDGLLGMPGVDDGKSIIGSPVHVILDALKLTEDQPTVIYITGKEDVWRRDMVAWLRQNGLPWDNLLYMRKAGDIRSDIAIKQQMVLQDIAGKYQPLFVIENNPMVSRALWHRLGIFCLSTGTDLSMAA